MIDISGCRITDIGPSALAHGCDQLQTIDLTSCSSITDIGLSALCDGCGQRQTINLSGYKGFKDIGL
jgi:Leucine Rich repeat